LLLVSLSLAACHRDADAGPAEPPAAAQSPAKTANPDTGTPSLVTLDRKVIKTATLTLSVEAPAAALAQARAIAERNGGYSQRSTNTGFDGGEAKSELVTVSLKVRAERFDDALNELRALGSGGGSESIEAKDVSEEYVDVDARLRTQRRVEEQYLALLKDAKNVGETLEVHKQLTSVRSEIERLEGKQRLLDHQIRLSTIDVTFEKQRPLLAISGGRFGRAVKQAGADLLNVGAAIVIWAIRAAGVLIPFGVLVLLPSVLLVRWGSRRRPKQAPAHSTA